MEQEGSTHGPYYLSFTTTSTDQVLAEVPLLLRIDGYEVDMGMSVKLATEEEAILQPSSSSISMFYCFPLQSTDLSSN